MSKQPPSLASELPLTLRHKLGLPLLVLYGTGITIGAGIYVLIGAVASHAGAYAPWAFVLSAVVMSLTVGSYAELSTRIPVSAGEAAYVKAAFNSRPFSIATGLLTIVIGVISASTVTIGSAGYIKQFTDMPQWLVVIAVVAALGGVAAWGILESVLLASLFTLIEVGGLLAIVVAAFYGNVPIASTLVQPLPLDASTLSGIGFEDLANVVEEAKVPHRDIPRAMVLTLLISTILYVAIAAIAVSAVSIERLSSSSAPLSLVFREVAGINPVTISIVAIVATLNTILAQITMAARVVYGMSRHGDLPRIAGRVHARTATPLVATGLIALLVIALALSVPFERLAESTSLATLVVFALVNLSLLRLRHRRLRSSGPHVRVPLWVPAAGLATCIAMIASAFIR